MKIKVLGCSAGIGGVLRTSSYLLDDDILFDVGTGAGDLSLEEMGRIDHIFLTHAHLDHCALLPMLVDVACGFRDKPVIVHAPAETIAALRACVFNWRLWPDYTVLPSADRPYLCYEAVEVGQSVNLGGRTVSPMPVRHAVPAVGYRIDSGGASLALSGDTTFCDEFWDALNRIENLRYLVMETAYPNANANMAGISGHMTPNLLEAGLSRLRRTVEVYAMHLEPGREEQTMAEIHAVAGGFGVRRLRQGQILEL